MEVEQTGWVYNHSLQFAQPSNSNCVTAWWRCGSPAPAHAAAAAAMKVHTSYIIHHTSYIPTHHPKQMTHTIAQLSAAQYTPFYHVNVLPCAHKSLNGEQPSSCRVESGTDDRLPCCLYCITRHQHPFVEAILIVLCAATHTRR